DSECQARAGDFRGRREVRARSDGRRARPDAVVLRREPRTRPCGRSRPVARGLRNGAVGHRQEQRRDWGRGTRRAEECGGMNAPTRINSALNVRDEFPGVGDWHYLDSAATAQKPQAVIEAIVQAYGPDYATVHRGIYRRS